MSVKWSLIAVLLFAALDPRGVATGMLDPIIGVAPINQTEVSYGDVVSIAVWRKVALTEAVAAILVPLPVALVAAYGALTSLRDAPGFAEICGIGFLLFGLLAAILLRRGLVVGAAPSTHHRPTGHRDRTLRRKTCILQRAFPSLRTAPGPHSLRVDGSPGAGRQRARSSARSEVLRYSARRHGR